MLNINSLDKIIVNGKRVFIVKNPYDFKLSSEFLGEIIGIDGGEFKITGVTACREHKKGQVMDFMVEVH